MSYLASPETISSVLARRPNLFVRSSSRREGTEKVPMASYRLWCQHDGASITVCGFVNGRCVN